MKIIIAMFVVLFGLCIFGAKDSAQAAGTTNHPMVGGCITNTTYGPRGMCSCTTCCYGGGQCTTNCYGSGC